MIMQSCIINLEYSGRVFLVAGLSL